MDRKGQEIIKYLANTDKQTHEFENNDLFHILGSLHLVIEEIDRIIAIITNALVKNQEWRDELGINQK